MKNSLKTLKKRNELKRYWKKVTDPNSFPHLIKRICKDCKKLKICRWQHSFTQTGKPEYRIRCQGCFLLYIRKWAKRNRKLLSKRKAQRAKITKPKSVND